MKLAAQHPEALRWPTLRTPATARTQNDVAANPMLAKVARQRRLILLRNLQEHLGCGALCSCANGKFAILLGDVHLGSQHGVGVESRDAKLANRFRGKANPAFYPAEKGQSRGLPESLVINARVPVRFPHSANGFPKRR